jgi:hypothetical protein
MLVLLLASGIANSRAEPSFGILLLYNGSESVHVGCEYRLALPPARQCVPSQTLHVFVSKLQDRRPCAFFFCRLQELIKISFRSKHPF